MVPRKTSCRGQIGVGDLATATQAAKHDFHSTLLHKSSVSYFIDHRHRGLQVSYMPPESLLEQNYPMGGAARLSNRQPDRLWSLFSKKLPNQSRSSRFSQRAWHPLFLDNVS